jgi:hypothetical protein
MADLQTELKRETTLYIILYILALIAGSIFLVTIGGLLGWAVFLGLALGGLAALVTWHARTFSYRCAHCEHVFEISFWKDWVSPHGLSRQDGWKLLRCPDCHRWSRAAIIPKRSLSERVGERGDYEEMVR